MMILRTIRLCALGALIAITAVPSWAAAPEGPAARPDSQRADAARSRRVELPFPLDIRTPDRAPPAALPQENARPHPFREPLLKRASLAGQPATRGRLSRQPDFS
jgi:hypothetical protein